MMRSLLWLAALSGAALGAPTATVKNGTYTGVSLPSFKQELFLGMPYAQQPLPPLLRLQPPRSLNTSWHGARAATEYSPFCIGYASGGSDDDKGYPLSEACLTLNVVRPAGVKQGSKIPVVAWIYGGGFAMGGSGDHRYNGSWIVQRSVEIGKPIIFASLNYRVNALGFLYSKEVQAEHTGNFGLLDQRLALRWLHENVAAFGGDPAQVTLMGESAGAISVALHLVAGGARSTDLFRGAIMESGTTATTVFQPAAAYQAQYDAVTKSAGCDSAKDTLACLRAVPLSTFTTATNRSNLGWNPVVDGVFLPEYPSRLLAAGKYVRVPILLGANTDEGTSFGTKGLNTSAQLAAALHVGHSALTNASVATLLALYPNDPYVGCPFGTGDTLLPSGRVDKQSNAIYGDIAMHAGRRALAQLMARTNPVYSYRFDQPPDNGTVAYGTGHFQEVAFVFSNPLPTQNPLSTRPGDAALAQWMTSAWAAFVHSGSPNYGQEGLQWPNYQHGAKNVVLRRHGNVVEDDDYRKEGIAFITKIAEELQN